MRPKYYSFYGSAIDSRGNEHIVTVVGEYTQTKEEEIKSEIVSVVNDNFQNVDGVLTYPQTKKHRTLTYSYSICHPDDNFNEELGVELAKKRLRHRPLGKLETDMVTSLCKDQIKLILFGELHYIIENIEKFLPKN